MVPILVPCILRELMVYVLRGGVLVVKIAECHNGLRGPVGWGIPELMSEDEENLLIHSEGWLLGRHCGLPLTGC
jgi:hypothetical protein